MYDLGHAIRENPFQESIFDLGREQEVWNEFIQILNTTDII